MFRGACFAYLLFFSAAFAQTPDKEARAIAQCGYLAFIAAEQLQDSGAQPERLDEMVADIVDFTAIFTALTARDNTGDVAEFTTEQLVAMTRTGQEVHSLRIRSMSEKNAVRLSNRILSDCRQDLALLAMKLGK